MKIHLINSVCFGRKLTPKEESEYCDVLNQGKKAVGNSGKSVLIVHSPSLPQNPQNNTGVGNLNTEEAQKFFEFAKKYWGINEIQLLPTGQYHSHNGAYPIYSGTSMDLGNHIINPKKFNLISEKEFSEIVKNNALTDKVNYSNVVNFDSVQEKVLRKSFDNFKKNKNAELTQKFNTFKNANSNWLEYKALYRILRQINKSHDYKNWQYIDKNLFDETIVKEPERKKRISEIYAQKKDEIEFYKFKQFLAEENLKEAKNKLNSTGLKLNGDMICGFSYDEVWANPKAFKKDTTIGWGLPALDLDNPQAEKLLRQKVNLYSKRFDGFRVDASWTYVNPNYKNNQTEIIEKKYYADKFLNIIDDEVLKVKGSNYDLHNIMHEFAASSDAFNIYEGESLRPYIDKRNKIYTSEWLNSDWGTNDAYLKRGWDKKNFILGATNHDSSEIKVDSRQAEILANILKIPKEKLMSLKEFRKAKFAEPMAAFNNMIFFKDALGLDEKFQHNTNPAMNFRTKIPSNYEEIYQKSIQNGKGFNPMDALEKNFKAKGLDKTQPELFKKIVKYRKILEEKSDKKWYCNKFFKYGLIFSAACAGILILGTLYKFKTFKEKTGID